jgi:hypothetical protein
MNSWYLRGAHGKWMERPSRFGCGRANGEPIVHNMYVGFGGHFGNGAGEGLSDGGGAGQWYGAGKGKEKS